MAAATTAAMTAATTTTTSATPAPVPAPAATAVTMALTPFVANTSTIDYQTKAGAELWKQSSKGLYGDSEELRYDLTAERLISFLDDLNN
jgi:nucleoid-associated protein YgaU